MIAKNHQIKREEIMVSQKDRFIEHFTVIMNRELSNRLTEKDETTNMLNETRLILNDYINHLVFEINSVRNRAS